MSKQQRRDVEFQHALDNFVRVLQKGSITVEGVVKAVDEAKWTADVTVGQVVFYSVPLRVLISSQASFVEVPAVGTACLITFKDNNIQRPTVQAVNEAAKMLIKCDEIVFNDGDLGGMVKAKVLETESNKDKGVLDALLSIINGSPITEPGNGAPSALQIALKAALVGKSTGTWSDLENEKILQ